MTEEPVIRRPDSPATAKQQSYLISLQRKVVALLGSQTPPEFKASTKSFSVVQASILIGQLRKTLEDGAPPLRSMPPKSDASGYEQGLEAQLVSPEVVSEVETELARRESYNAREQELFEGEHERDVPIDGRTSIRVWKKHPNHIRTDDDIFPQEYWGWSWICFHPMHRSPIEGASGRPHSVTLNAAMQHWKKFHKPKDE